MWFDAHANLDTPDDNVSGYFDVMALAMLTGAGWRAQWVSVPGLPAIPGRNVVPAGVRDLEPYQRWRLEASEVRVVAGAIDPDRRVGRVNLHVDVDALDVAAGRANQYAAPGPSLEGYRSAIAAVFAGSRCLLPRSPRGSDPRQGRTGRRGHPRDRERHR